MTDNRLENIMSTYASLSKQRAPWESWWNNLKSCVLPRRTADNDDATLPGGGEFDKICDTTAIESCQKLASGHMSYITPSHEVWFKWSMPDNTDEDEAEAWYNQCSEIALKELSISNFYTEIHECYLDRVALGTGSIYIGTTSDNRLLFKNIPCGKFACAENEEGSIDTYFREFRLSPHQAENMFGKKSLGAKVKSMLENGKDVYSPCLRFLHLVRPRGKRNRQKETALNMPYESIYVSLDDKNIVEEGGYHEFPYLVTRFLKWGDGPYGLAPGRLIYPAIRQAQFLNRILDTLGEVAAFPRILELANQIGEVDMRAGGRTVITPEAAALHLPKEWATQGRYDIGIDRLNQKQEAIRKAYYLPMLELWGDNRGSMTATEVMARENERVLTFFPSFSLFVSDLYPAMCRIFSILFRMGKFPEPPRSVIKQVSNGKFGISNPQVVYQSKIALVLRRIQIEGIDRTLSRLPNMMQASPELIDHIDWDKCFRMTGRIEGLPEQVLRPMKEVMAMRKKRQEAEAPPQQAQEAEENPLAPLLDELTANSRRK